METEDFHLSILHELEKSRSLKHGSMPSWHDHFLDVWDIVKKAETARSEDDLLEFHSQIKKQHNVYISKINRWVLEKQSSKSSDSEIEREVKIRASGLKPKFEKGLYRYTLCFLYLNRLLIHTKRDISSTLRLLPETNSAMPIVNQNIGFLLKRAYSEKKKLQSDHEKLKRMRGCLYDLEALFLNINQLLFDLFGQKSGDRLYTAFRAHLRSMDFEAASLKIHNALKQSDLTHQKVQKTRCLSDDIISILQANLDDLKRDTDMVLDSSELRFLFSFLNTSEVRVHKFIDKYTAPYLAFQYQLLLKQAFRLGQIGSFEKLFVLHKDFIKGMPLSYERAEDVRAYESDTLRKVEHTLVSGMSNIPDIFDQMEDTKTGLYQILTLIRDCHTDK